jgi:hypothetical protein
MAKKKSLVDFGQLSELCHNKGQQKNNQQVDLTMSG